jgi:glutathione S-transferase
LDESRAIMDWALSQDAPHDWAVPTAAQAKAAEALVVRNDGYFKHHLDRYKYSARFEGEDPLVHRQAAEVFLDELEALLSTTPYLFGESFGTADAAIAPFIRQFASADRDWFDQRNSPKLQAWLDRFLSSPAFVQCMKKHKQWHSGDKPIGFPEQNLN